MAILKSNVENSWIHVHRVLQHQAKSYISILQYICKITYTGATEAISHDQVKGGTRLAPCTFQSTAAMI